MPKKKRAKLLIVDGNALVHRSFHALPPTLKTKKGEITNAVFGFISFLLKSFKEIKPDYAALTFDRKAPTFRHEEFADYKATRVKAPDELYEQLPRIKEATTAFGLPIFELDGFEADDLIGTIAKKSGTQVDTIIVTGDMDTLQLVDDTTFVFAMSRGFNEAILYDEKKVKEKYGIRPDQIIDYKALRGDPSDNIPGIRGIGEKTASELISAFGDLDTLYKELKNKKSPGIKKLSERLLELLKNGEKDARLSRRLAEIKCDVEIDFDLERAKFFQGDKQRLVDLFNELEFKSLLGRLKDLPVGKNKEAEQEKINKFSRDLEEFDYRLIDDDKKFKKFLSDLKKQKYFSFDTETSDLDNFSSDLLGASFSWREGEAYFIPLNLKSSGQKRVRQNDLFGAAKKDFSEKIDWFLELKKVLENKDIKKTGHNLKFDYKILKSFDCQMAGIDFDSMIASYLLNPDSRRHGLDALVLSEFGFEKITSEDLLGGGRQKIKFSEVPLDKLSVYAAEDADFAGRLKEKLFKELEKKKSLVLLQKFEMPLLPILAEMEIAGIKIDKNYLAELDKEIDGEIKVLEKKIWKLSESEFNINSVQQLREILFTKLQISPAGISKTKTGLSTGVEELLKLRDEHEIIPLILKYRELAKLSNTYAKALPELVNPFTGRIHTNYNQAIAATGRLSSNNPNLQNIPTRTELGRKIRHAFVASENKKLLSLDYSQIELRIAAHLSGDEKMIKAFRDNLDIHTATAAAINKVPLEKVSREMRSAAKSVNFGILYGQGAYGLAQNAEISFAEAKDFIAKYFDAYPDIKKYIDKTLVAARESGYVETIFGRRRYLPDLNSTMPMIKKSAERMAINAPIQGTAADIIKLAMIETDKFLQKNSGATMLLQVHDELIFEVDEDRVDFFAKSIKKIMDEVAELSVPIIVDVKSGDNWGEME